MDRGLHVSLTSECDFKRGKRKAQKAQSTSGFSYCTEKLSVSRSILCQAKHQTLLHFQAVHIHHVRRTCTTQVDRRAGINQFRLVLHHATQKATKCELVLNAKAEVEDTQHEG